MTQEEIIRLIATEMNEQYSAAEAQIKNYAQFPDNNSYKEAASQHYQTAAALHVIIRTIENNEWSWKKPLIK